MTLNRLIVLWSFLAAMLELDCPHQRGDVLAAGDVDRHGGGGVPPGANLGRRPDRGFAIDVGDVDVGPLLGEEPGDRDPDAGARAGDERNPVLEPLHGSAFRKACDLAPDPDAFNSYAG